MDAKKLHNLIGRCPSNSSPVCGGSRDRALRSFSLRTARVVSARLCRSRRPDWRATAATGNTLLEFCGLVGTSAARRGRDLRPAASERPPSSRHERHDERDGKLSLFRQRSLEALKQKARRGELFLNVAVGYLKTSRERIEKNPDRRVQEAITFVFRKFAELQTVCQVTSLAAAGAAAAARGRSWAGGPARRVEAARLQHAPSPADQSDLRRAGRPSLSPLRQSQARYSATI